MTCVKYIHHRCRAARLLNPLVRLGVLLIVASCGSVPSTPPSSDTTQRVVETALRNIDSRYVTDVSIEKVAIDGLEAVAQTIPRAAVTHENGTLAFIRDGVRVDEWRMPGKHDHLAWSALVTDFFVQAYGRAQEANEREKTLAVFFHGGLAGLDRYTRYEMPDEARNTRARREGFGGLGITIRYENGVTFVRDVHPGTPAERAGILPGDRITHIGIVDLEGLSQNEVVSRLRGPLHSTADLTLSRAGRAAPLQVSVVRAHIILPTVTASRDRGVLSLKITGFNQGTSRSLSKELAAAERDLGHDLKGIILDLRSNPGGLLDQAVTVSDFFLNDGRIISTKGRHRGANQIFDASWGERVRTLPIVLLINGRSASASEIVAAALRDRGRAIIVGTSSFGKGSVQTIIRLPNGGELTMTWAHMFAPSGFTLQGHGVIPAICTVGTGGTFAQMIAAVRHQGDRTAATVLGDMLASRHAVRSDPDKARQACPASKEERAEDTEIARFIIENKPLYTRALVDGGPAIAEGG